MPKQSIGEVILQSWQRLHKLPGGKFLFSYLMGKRVPYSSTISAKVLELEPGHTKVELKDHKRVRNHLNSIHAVALVNLGEMASGLALLCSLPNNVRGIVTNINIDYHMKARGDLVAVGKADVPPINEDTDCVVHSTITNSDNEIVSSVTVNWRLGIK